jgi:hypothetical protein
MWVLNGQIRISEGALLAEAALLAFAYLLRVRMAGSYMRHVRERAFGTAASKGVGAAGQAVALARLLAWKITLAAGALAALPSVAGTSWLYSACQFASLEAQENGTERHSLVGCVGLANQWFSGGLLLFLMLFPLWTAVWLNLLILAVVLPQLLHSILGVNTLLSTQIGIYSLIESSAFWLALLAGAWLAIDPIVKCTFVVVYQHLRSRREGDDLRGLLMSLPRAQQKKAQLVASGAAGGMVMPGALLVLAAILLGFSATASAAPPPQAQSTTEMPASSGRGAQVQRLRLALDQESHRAIYRWHDVEHPSTPTWLDKSLERIWNSIDHALRAIERFLRKLWPRGWKLSLGNEKRGAWQLKGLRLWLAAIAIVTLVAGALLFVVRRRREPALLSISVEIAPLPGLSDSAAASERSEYEWFALASRLEGEGELRLALRAAYLGLLSGLAQREWLTIRRDRTNREYLNEFTRRWRRRPQAALEARADIPEQLRGSLRQFDRVWYGSHAMTRETVTAYCQNQREFLSHV